MKRGRAAQARILNHDSGMGAPDSETVRKRAGELAQIDGRPQYSEYDWQQAKRELHGGQSPDSEEDPVSISEAMSDNQTLPVDTGHHVRNLPVEDADNIVEELIVEGMEEAVHEQMLEASKLETGEEES